MRLDIEFATRSRFRSTGVQVLIVGALFAMVAVSTFVTLEITTKSIDAQVTQARASVNARQPVAQAVSIIDPAEQQSIRHASQELSIEWERMLRAIEDAHTDPITLLSIESEASGSTLRVTGTGQSYAAVLEFVERLSNRAFFSDVLLASHQATSQAPDSPFKFVITAHWRVK